MSVRRALVFSFLDRAANIVIGLATSMVVARLLSPADIGVFSVAMVMMSFLTMLRDFGAGQYMVQEPDLTPVRIRAVWTVQLIMGSGLGLLALMATWPMSYLYAEPQLRAIVAVLALCFFINPLGSLTYAWLMRSMRLEAVALMRSSSALANSLVAVACAWSGMGAISLAWGSLAGVVANALISLRYRPAGFPLMPGRQELGRVFRFGGQLTSMGFLEAMARGAPELLLGKLQGMASVGQYSRGAGLLSMLSNLLVEAIGTVVMPMFAKQRREGGDQIAAFYKVVAYMTAVSWSAAAVAGLLAGPMIQVMFGSQWGPAVPVARWLAVAMVLAGPASLAVHVLIGLGASDRLTRGMLVSAGALIAGAATGANFSIEATAAGVCAGTLLATLNWMRLIKSRLNFSPIELVKLLTRSAGVAAITAVGPSGVLWYAGWSPPNSFGVLLIGSTLAVLGFLVGVTITRHPIHVEFLKLGERLRQWTPSS